MVQVHQHHQAPLQQPEDHRQDPESDLGVRNVEGQSQLAPFPIQAEQDHYPIATDHCEEEDQCQGSNCRWKKVFARDNYPAWMRGRYCPGHKEAPEQEFEYVQPPSNKEGTFANVVSHSGDCSWELQSASTIDAASLQVSYELPTVTDEKEAHSVYPEGEGTIRG